MRLRRVRAAALAGAVTLAGVAIVTAPPASAAAGGVVINEVYGGGGNAGSTWTNDFIELYNPGVDAVDLSTWSVQYASAAGSTWTNKTNLVGSIPAGGYYLIQEAAQGGGTTFLPTADASGTIAISGTAGKIALVSNQTALGCAADCDAAAGVIDFVGFGTTANDVEGTGPAPAPSNTTSVSRTAGADANQNATDFTTGTPSPTNKAGQTTGTPVVPPVTCSATPGTTRIHDIQGSGWLTSASGTTVSSVPGVVTQLKFGSSGGFYMQDPTPDADPATSEAIFVFTGGTPSVAIGTSVTVCGTVSEFRSGGATSANLAGTQISPPTGGITTVATGVALPAALAITPASVPEVYAPANGGADIELLNPVVPTRSALDFWESHEGELVTLSAPRLVGPANEFDESYVTTKPDQQATVRGGTYADSYDIPSGRLELLSRDTSLPWPAANVGDVYAGTVTGTVDYNGFGGYLLVVDPAALVVTDNGLTPTVAETQGADQLAVATYNVENLSPGNPQAKFDRLAVGVVSYLASPDVVALEEIQDNNGATSDGTVAADQTMAKFIAAIVAAGGPAYEYRTIDPVDGADGGEPGGNIRTVLMFNPQRVTFVDTPGGTATSSTTIVVGDDGVAHLSASPGRIDPTNAAWSSSRKPLAGEFLFNGKTVIVVANHFNSKGGDQSADGRFQPPARSSEVQRVNQATVLHGFVADLLAADPDAALVAAGDINDYPYSPALSTLTTGPNGDQPVLTDLITLLPPQEQYTYVFNGISQVLDHILVTPSLVPLADYEVIHANAEFGDQASDHDPQVVRLGLEADPVYNPQVSVAPATEKAGATVTVTITGFAPNTPLTLTLDTVALGTATADGSGNATVPVVVPAGTAVGPHTVTVTGGELSATASLTVEPTPPPVITVQQIIKLIRAILRSLFGFGIGR